MYDVGQVLYVILEKKHAILPVRVTEQIVRRTVEGESISYKVEVPGKNQIMSLSDLGKSHHSSLDSVKKKLLSNAESAIHAMSDKAASIAKEFFHENYEELTIPEPISSPSQSKSQDDSAKVDLGDGVVANINLEALEALGGKK